MYRLRLDSYSDAGRRDAHTYSYCSSAGYCTSYGYSYRRAAVADQTPISISDPRSWESHRRDGRWH